MTPVRLLLLVCLVSLAGCDGDDAVRVDSVHTWDLPVTTIAAGAPRTYTAVGSVVSDTRIEVASRLSGYLLELNVREGDRVHRGQSLARVDSADIDGAIDQARAGNASAEAAARDAKIDAERFERLYVKGMVSEIDMRKVRLRMDTTGDALNQARAALDSAEAQRRYASIVSPQDGEVVAVVRKPGDLVMPGAPILLVESVRNLVFETTVTEMQVAALRVGQRVPVRIDGLQSPVAGRIARIVQSADPVTRTYPVKISLPAKSDVLPGMFGRADFPVGGSDAVVIGRELLIERAGLRGVFVVDARNTMRFRWLRIGREWPDRVEVVAGLTPGERVVANAGPTLREGDRLVQTALATERGR